MHFKPDQTIAVITRGEYCMLYPFVLKDTPLKATGYSNVERVAATGHDVREIAVVVDGASLTPNVQN